MSSLRGPTTPTTDPPIAAERNTEAAATAGMGTAARMLQLLIARCWLTSKSFLGTRHLQLSHGWGEREHVHLTRQ